jgi:ankyrin repeat protein
MEQAAAAIDALRAEFMKACRAGDHAKIRSLAKRLPSVNFMEKGSIFGEQAPLHFICFGKKAEDVLWFLEHTDADPCLKAGDEWTVLHYACRDGLEPVVRKLLELKVPLDEPNGEVDTALIEACNSGHANIVKLLLEAGAKPDITDEMDRTPLIVACAAGKEECAALLAAGGFDVDHATSFERESALHFAAREGLLRVVFTLLKMGCLPSQKTLAGKNCLMFAAKGGSVGATRIFLEIGFKKALEEKDLQGRTSLHHAAAGLHPATVSLLIEAGADIEARFKGRCRAIHCALDRFGLADVDDDDEIWHDANSDPRAEEKMQTLIKLIEMGCELDFDQPGGFRDGAFEADLANALAPFLQEVALLPSGPIKPFRRLLRWGLDSGRIEETAEDEDFPLQGAAKSAEEAAEMKEARLSELKDDAWKRRRHLCIDRALWRKPAAPSEAKKAKGGESQSASQPAAGAGKA